jgi:MSHA biogenesis protein MshQ
MKMIKRLAVTLGLSIAVSSVGLTQANAATLSGNLTADDAFTAYISTSDSVLGDALASGSYWGTPQSFAAALTSGTNYYLHIAATDLYGPPSAFLGSFSLTGAEFKFANGAQSLVTNATDWNVSASGFGSSYITPYTFGNNGIGPWGTMTSIDPKAQWIWTGPSGTVGKAYFSTTIAAVPEPETYAMLLAGLGFMGFVASRKKQNAA